MSISWACMYLPTIIGYIIQKDTYIFYSRQNVKKSEIKTGEYWKNSTSLLKKLKKNTSTPLSSQVAGRGRCAGARGPAEADEPWCSTLLLWLTKYTCVQNWNIFFSLVWTTSQRKSILYWYFLIRFTCRYLSVPVWTCLQYSRDILLHPVW